MNVADVTKPASRSLFAWLLHFLASVMFLALAACGGGGGGGGGGSSPPPPPIPDFTLAASPNSQSVDVGSSSSVSLSAAALHGFSAQISVQVTGDPSGVSASPASFTLVPGTPQQVTLTAAANAPTANATITFTGTSGPLTHTAGLALSVNGSSSGTPIRTRYLRTDATTEYFGWVNQHWILYHAATSRYFVTDLSSNRVIVIDAGSQTELGTISVPGAFGIDDTPDHATLYVGTQIGDVYAIDPVGMTVTHRYIASEIGPYGYLVSTALVLSDGRLALIGPYNGIDGTGSVAVWNPVDNSIQIYGGFTGNSLPLPCSGFPSLGGFARTVDRTQILLGSINGGGLCELNPSTGTGNFVSSGSSLNITTSPDGKYIVLPDYSGDAVIYDAQTLTVVATFGVLGNTANNSNFLVSTDSKTLFVPTDTIIYAYNIATRKLVGWAPNIFVPPTSGGSAFGSIDSPNLQATDGTGLFAGPLEQGVGFVDLSTLQTGAVGTQFTNGYLAPAAGPTAGGTATQWSDPNTPGTLKGVYFNSKQATSISASSGSIHATSPPGKAGPADIYAFTTNGGMQLLPEAFSYGPTLLELTPDMATAEGGGTGHIYGYGFGPVNSNTIPTDLKVTVAGVTTQITGFVANAYGTASPPYPLQSVAYTIPPGTARSTVNATVSTNDGTSASGTLHYLPSIQSFPLLGSTLIQGIYDAYTDLYYFTDTNKIQVFSRTQGKWLSPISIPAPSGPAQRLWGIALSPDGSKLAVSDANAGAIYVLDPTNPTAVQTFIVGSQSGFVINPCAVAISDAGNVYYIVYVLGQGGGADQFFKLNTQTGAITNYGLDGPGLEESDLYLRNAISSDNSRVFYNMYGYVFSIDTATDRLSPAADGYGCCYGNYELALSSNQTQFTATGYLYDSDLNGESYYALNDREILDIADVYGAKLSPDGRLLFQPSLNGIDVLDGRLGNLLSRISLPVALSPNYDALVADGKDNILIAITGTGNGIAIVDLTSVSEPQPLPYRVEVTSRRYPLGTPANLSSRNTGVGTHPNGQNPQLLTHPRTILHVTRKALPLAK